VKAVAVAAALAVAAAGVLLALAALAPGDAETITVACPRIQGEAYDIELLTSTGRTVGYEVEEAA
jgi:hypothetical protein